MFRKFFHKGASSPNDVGKLVKPQHSLKPHQYVVRVSSSDSVYFEARDWGQQHELSVALFDFIADGKLIKRNDILVKIQGIEVTGLAHRDAMIILMLASTRNFVTLTFHEAASFYSVHPAPYKGADGFYSKNNSSRDLRLIIYKKPHALLDGRPSLFAWDRDREHILSPYTAGNFNIRCGLRCIEFLQALSGDDIPIMNLSPRLAVMVRALYSVFEAGRDCWLEVVLGYSETGVVVALHLLVRALSSLHTPISKTLVYSLQQHLLTKVRASLFCEAL